MEKHFREDTLSRKIKMSTNTWVAIGRTRPPSHSEVMPQYVHHLAPKSLPEITPATPQQKDSKQRCVKWIAVPAICSLLLFLLAGILLAYYYSSACVHGIPCGGNTGCVWESQWCDGLVDCPAGQDEAYCVRLHGSSFLVQIFSTHRKQWTTVCSHGWTAQQARTSCRDIGYSESTSVTWGLRQAHSDDGFLMVKSDPNPHVPIVQQVEFSNDCPDNTVVTLLCTDCTRGVNSSRVSKGQQASLGSWPWHVSLQLKNSHRCGGAIISPYWIVTVAHCAVMTSSPEDWSVYAGLVDPLGILFNPAHAVSLIIAHEGFDRITHKNDIALMRLTKPLDFTASSNVGPVCLPNVGLNISVPVNGWTTGYVVALSGDSPHLMEAQVTLTNAAACNSSATYNGRISKDMLCAKGVQPGSDACGVKTDSGGPVVAQSDGLWWLLGDNIWPESCSDPNKPGVYSNVTFFLDWIHHQMKKHQND
ncbi:transmembrane protease serine 2-like [Syngnathoides biaculeatus]|uniref:transmembrane protease serine 2-like n=1 Tax=Syngnathoides biaculeatus TaxID=300417 RepID=UPI002ADD8B8F|nr:transmembrane protease serine 2-like [Syngnathoides biaculeatus]